MRMSRRLAGITSNGITYPFYIYNNGVIETISGGFEAFGNNIGTVYNNTASGYLECRTASSPNGEYLFSTVNKIKLSSGSVIKFTAKRTAAGTYNKIYIGISETRPSAMSDLTYVSEIATTTMTEYTISGYPAGQYYVVLSARRFGSSSNRNYLYVKEIKAEK